MAKPSSAASGSTVCRSRWTNGGRVSLLAKMAPKRGQRPLAASGLLRPRARPRASDEASEDSLSFSRLDAMPQHERQLIRFEAKPKRGRRSGERETAQILAQVAEAEATALGLRDRGPELRHHPLTTPAF